MSISVKMQVNNLEGARQVVSAQFDLPSNLSTWKTSQEQIKQTICDVFIFSFGSWPSQAELGQALEMICKGPRVRMVINQSDWIVVTRDAWLKLSSVALIEDAKNPCHESLLRARLARVIDWVVVGDPSKAKAKSQQLPTAQFQYPQETKDARVLFFVPYGAWLVHNQVDALLASALRLRGAQVEVVGCDGVFKDGCYVLALSKDKETDCALCAKKSQDFFPAFGLPLAQLRNFLVPEDYSQIENWLRSLDPANYANAVFEDLPIGKWVAPTINSYFRVSRCDFSDPTVRAAMRRYLGYGLLIYRAMNRIIDHFKPTNLVLFNGHGLLHGTVLNLAIERNIPVLAHEKGWANGTFMFANNQPVVSTIPQFECLDAWADIPLKQDELERVRQFYINREEGVDANYIGFYSFKSDHTTVRQKLNIPADARIFSVFSSSEYEFIYWKPYEKLYEQFDMIDRLIEIFRDRPEYLVIRHHPAICGMPVGNPDFRLIQRAYQQAASAPANVRVIMPQERLTSYALLWHTDACIALSTTVAVEAAARGIPAAASDTCITDRATFCSISHLDKESLEKIVNQMLEAKFDDRHLLSKVYRFTNTFYYLYAPHLKSIGVKGTSEPEISINSIEDLMPGFDPALDRVCDSIIKGTPVYALPRRDENEMDEQFEAKFFAEHGQYLSDYRGQVRQRARKLSQSTDVKQVEVYNLNCALPGMPNFEEQWSKRCRYRGIVLNQNKPSKLDQEHDLLLALKNRLDISSTPYFYIWNSFLQVDESAIGSSVEYLEGNANLKGVLWGVWSSNQQGNLSESVFTARNPLQNFEKASQIAPLLKNPLVLLSTVIFRREALQEILEQLIPLSDSQKRCEYLYFLLMGELILKTENPMIVMPHAKVESKEEFSFNSVGSAISFLPAGGATQIVEVPNQPSPEELVGSIQYMVQVLNAGQFDQAKQKLESLRGQEFQLPILHYFQALIAVKEARLTDARTSLTMFLEREPNTEQARNLLKEINQALNN